MFFPLIPRGQVKNGFKGVFTIKVCQFFNVIPQVSSDCQGLFHLQVCFSRRGRTNCVIVGSKKKWRRKKGRKAEADDDKNEEEKEKLVGVNNAEFS